MLIVVSYDVIDNKKRTKLAKKLCDFGIRVQYSVFECRLNKSQLKEMRKESLKFIDEEKDSLRIYKICSDCVQKIESYGIKQGLEEEDKPIVI